MQLPKNRYAPFVLRRCLCALTFLYSTVIIEFDLRHVEGLALNLRCIGIHRANKHVEGQALNLRLMLMHRAR